MKRHLRYFDKLEVTILREFLCYVIYDSRGRELASFQRFSDAQKYAISKNWEIVEHFTE